MSVLDYERLNAINFFQGDSISQSYLNSLKINVSGGVVEAIENKKSGFLINPNSQKELEDKIYWIYKNPLKAKKMGEYGKKRVQEKFMQNRNRKFINYLGKLKIQKNI